MTDDLKKKEETLAEKVYREILKIDPLEWEKTTVEDKDPGRSEYNITVLTHGFGPYTVEIHAKEGGFYSRGMDECSDDWTQNSGYWIVLNRGCSQILNLRDQDRAINIYRNIIDKRREVAEKKRTKKEALENEKELKRRSTELGALEKFLEQ